MFRAYDIRGIYGSDLTENVMEAVGNAFASLFVKDSVVVGMDGRISSPQLRKAFITGVLKAGKDVTDVGLVPRSACLFAAWKSGKPSAYITASHLPPEWNGVKFAHGNGVEFFEEDNNKIRDAVLSGKAVEAQEKGSVNTLDAIESYKKYILSRMPEVERPLRVVLDCGNGTAGLAAPDIFRAMGFEVKTLFSEVDGRFPNRPSEISESALQKLSEEMKNADMGIAYDGDADRMSLMDEKGRILGPETSAYIILGMLAVHEKGPIVANVECLKIMDEVAEKYKRRLYRIRVGNSFMVHEVNARKACFGVERSGHFCLPSVMPMDDGIAASAYAAAALSAKGRKLSEIVDELPHYPFVRHKVECPDEKKFAVINRLKEKLSGKYQRVNTIDGVRVDLDYGWVLIRASNTEPVIRLSAEADNKKNLKELANEFLEALKNEIKSS